MERMREMKGWAMVRGVVLGLGLGLSLWGQTRSETTRFIVSEMKTLEAQNYTIREVFFSENDTLFTFASSGPGKADQRLIIPLDNVDIFMTKVLTRIGHYHYNLVVQTRGKAGRFQINGIETSGSTELVKNGYNKTKIEKPTKAFNHLKKLNSEP